MKQACSKLLAKSKANFGIAIDLKDKGEYNAAANRFYYSIFQAVKAYAVEKGKMRVGERDHVHPKAKQIAKDEDERYFDLMEDAYEMRTKADYLSEDVEQNELNMDFLSKAQDMRDHFERLAQSA
jgi:uncharacterized protein (UPF0332 family)